MRCKESTINLYKSYLKNIPASLLLKKAKDITKRDINLLILELKRKNLSNKYINCLLGFILAVFNYGIDNDWISKNPVKKIEKLPREKKDPRFLDEEEMELFIKAIQDFPIRKRIALLFALFTGVRISELTAVEWQDFDFTKRTILINKQYYKGKLSSPKTYKSTRILNMCERLRSALLELKSESKVLSKIVFCSSTGGYMSQDKFVKIWFKKAMRRIGKPDFNFHGLRHTYATYLIQNGVSIHYVSESLGHSSPQTTLNIYDHILPKVNNMAMDLFDNLEKSQNNRIKNFDRVQTQ